MQLTKANLKETLLKQSFQIEVMRDIGIIACVMNRQGLLPSDFFDVMTHLTTLRNEKDATRIWDKWAKYQYGIGSIVKLMQKYNGNVVEKPLTKTPLKLKSKPKFEPLLFITPNKALKEVVVERTREEMMAEYLSNNTIEEIPYGVTKSH